jgi:hypothetical protein
MKNLSISVLSAQKMTHQKRLKRFDSIWDCPTDLLLKISND